jgi:hypothetical protein
VASTKRTGRTAHKKYVPSIKQLADDERTKERLDHLTRADLKKFDAVLGRSFKEVKRSDTD